MEYRLVHNQKESYHYDHIPFNLERIINLFLRVSAMFLVNKDRADNTIFARIYGKICRKYFVEIFFETNFF